MISQLELGQLGYSPVVHDVTGGNLERLDDLLDLFSELFPQYAHTAERLRQKASRPGDANPRFIEHQWLVDVGGRAAGLFSFKYARRRQLGFTVYIGIRPAYRSMLVEGMRMSEWLIGQGLKQVARDAQAAEHEPPVGLFLEVEPPRLVARYREFGFVELPVVYHEPRFRKARVGQSGAIDLAQVDFHRISLGGFPYLPERFDPSDPAMLTDVVLAFMEDHYRLPRDNWAVRRALSSIPPASSLYHPS